MRIAVVTGASSGYGKEFAKQIGLEKNLDEIWVIARRKERLEELQKELRIPVRPLALDLIGDEGIQTYDELLQKEQPEVAVLVNAAGFGFFQAFTGEPLEHWLGVVDLNDKALLSLTYHTLPYMRAGGEIYNFASSSAFQPVPYIAVYGASKAFVLSFSRALNVELRERKIRVMAVCPHWTKTEFFDTAVKDETVIAYYNFFNSVPEVVKTAFRNMKKGKDVSLCGFKIKLQVFMIRHLPHRLVMRVWCRQQKKPV